MFSEVRPCKTFAEADMLYRRWLKKIGPEVIQFWRSHGWGVPKWLPETLLEQAKILKLQDKKIRVSVCPGLI